LTKKFKAVFNFCFPAFTILKSKDNIPIFNFPGLRLKSNLKPHQKGFHIVEMQDIISTKINLLSRTTGK
jgi:hypothetical protein